LEAPALHAKLVHLRAPIEDMDARHEHAAAAAALRPGNAVKFWVNGFVLQACGADKLKLHSDCP